MVLGVILGSSLWWLLLSGGVSFFRARIYGLVAVGIVNKVSGAIIPDFRGARVMQPPKTMKDPREWMKMRRAKRAGAPARISGAGIPARCEGEASHETQSVYRRRFHFSTDIGIFHFISDNRFVLLGKIAVEDRILHNGDGEIQAGACFSRRTDFVLGSSALARIPSVMNVAGSNCTPFNFPWVSDVAKLMRVRSAPSLSHVSAFIEYPVGTCCP